MFPWGAALLVEGCLGFLGFVRNDKKDVRNGKKGVRNDKKAFGMARKALGITMALLRPHEVMKTGWRLSDGSRSCRAYPPQCPTVGTGSESGKTGEGVCDGVAGLRAYPSPAPHRGYRIGVR